MMSRVNWKLKYISETLLKKNIKRSNKDIKDIKIWERNSVIPAFLINKLVFVHNGKEFKEITITPEKIGFKFGEFALTRKPYIYKGKKKAINKKKK